MNFLSSGLLYRYCALKIIRNKKLCNVNFINRIAKTITIKNYKIKTFTKPEISKVSSIIAKKPFVKSINKFSKNFIEKV